MSEEMSPADVMALANSGNCGANAWMNNPFMYLIWLAMFGNGGFCGWNNGNASMQNSLTRAELTDGFNNQNVQNDLRSVQSSVAEGFAGVANNLCSGFGGVNSNINSNSNAITQAINTNTFQGQLNANGLSNAIGNLKYDMAQNCCDLKTVMHGEGEATRALITQNTIQDLRDKLADKDNELQSAQFTLANANQTQNILNTLGRYMPYQGMGAVYGCSNNW